MCGGKEGVIRRLDDKTEMISQKNLKILLNFLEKNPIIIMKAMRKFCNTMYTLNYELLLIDFIRS